MGRLFLQFLEGKNIFVCRKCKIHLTSYNSLISKGFSGITGKAFLFGEVVNIIAGPGEDRMLISGQHSVCDVICKKCEQVLGWKYDKAYEQSQKYKEGKYVLERANIVKHNWNL